MMFTIYGIPIPQQRARVLRTGYAYDLPKCRQAKKLIAEIAVASRQANANPLFSPDSTARLTVTLKFFGARRNADLDNLYKLVADALQGVLYRNDSQIDHAEIWRHPANNGEERTEVIVNTL